MKRLIHGLLSITLAMSIPVTVNAATDTRILTDPISGVYTGTPQGSTTIENLRFNDIGSENLEKEAVIRSGALNMIKGYSDDFQPDKAITNEEAVAIVIRAMGMEQEAQERAVTLGKKLDQGSPLRDIWSLGYLDLARETGVISQEDFDKATALDQENEQNQSFVRDRAATREDVVYWLITGLDVIGGGEQLSVDTTPQQYIYKYGDWQELSADRVKTMEYALEKGVLSPAVTLNPKGQVTKKEMTQALKNMDNTYYDIEAVSIEKQTGTVGGVTHSQETTTNEGTAHTDIYVRDKGGEIDVLRYVRSSDTDPATSDLNAVVYKNGQVLGLTALEEGDEIEYLTKEDAATVLYVNVINSQIHKNTVQGRLNWVDPLNGKLEISDGNGKRYEYTMIDGLTVLEPDHEIPLSANETKGELAITEPATIDYVIFDGQKTNVKDLPIGSYVSLSLKNDLVDEIKYIGQPEVVLEQRAVVVNNNKEQGYLTYYDSNGYGAKTYTTPIDAQGGDTIFMRLSPEDRGVIVEATVANNYVTRHGKIKEIDRDDVTNMLVEYENGQTSWLEIPKTTPITNEGKPASVEDLKVGDGAKLVINNAILSRGTEIEFVKEMEITGSQKLISKVVKGKFAGIDVIQNKLLIKDAQNLEKTGWSGHQNLAEYKMDSENVKYYNDGEEISPEYALKHLKNSENQVYVALENNYGDDMAKKVSFRSGRDELLEPDRVVSSDNGGKFAINGNDGDISTDMGTIVRSFGRLVEGKDINREDYLVVSLNGEDMAAVVDIEKYPDNSAITVIRGRVSKVNDGKSFSVRSMAVLEEGQWAYTPVNAEFSIDYDTIYINEEGLVEDEKFITYTDDSVYDKSFNIVANGAQAQRIYDAPYPKESLRGVIYSLSEEGLGVKDAFYKEEATGKWKPVSKENNILTIKHAPNTIMVKNNEIVTSKDLVIGQQIKVMTDELPETITSGDAINAFIIYVEK